MNTLSKVNTEWRSYINTEDEETVDEERYDKSDDDGVDDQLISSQSFLSREEIQSSEILGSIFYASKADNPRFTRLKNVQQRIFSEGMSTTVKKAIRYKNNSGTIQGLLDPERLDYSIRVASHLKLDIKSIELTYYILAIYELNYFLDTNNTLDRTIFITLEHDVDHTHFNQRYMHILAHLARDLYTVNTKILDFSNLEIKLMCAKLREYIVNYKEILIQSFRKKHTQEDLIEKYFDAQCGLFFCKLMMLSTITNELQKVSYKLYRHELQADRLTPAHLSKLADLVREKLLVNKNVTVKSPLYFVLALLKYFDRRLYNDYTTKLTTRPQIHNVANLERHRKLFAELEEKVIVE